MYKIVIIVYIGEVLVLVSSHLGAHRNKDIKGKCVGKNNRNWVQ